MKPSGEIEVGKNQGFPSVNGHFNGQEKLPGNMVFNHLPQNDFESIPGQQMNGGFGQNYNLMSQYNPYYQYARAYYDPYYDVNMNFTSKFPRAKDYSKLSSIHEAFPHLKEVNDPNFNIESISSDAHFYILRSSNDDNIHKAIKYQTWSSTPSGKNILRKAWHEFTEQGKAPEIYLFFSVVSSNQFLGVAKMASDINDDESFKYWWEPCKWFGTFKVSWIFIKDIHYQKFESIKEEAFNTSVINLKDGTKIGATAGKEMLKVFANNPVKPNIFDFFDFMDRREDYIRTQRDSDPEFDKYFAECCIAYKENPDAVFMPKRSFQSRRAPKKSYNGNHKKYGHGNGHTNNHNSNGHSQRDHQKRSPKKSEDHGVSLADFIKTENEKKTKKNKTSKKAKKNGVEDKSFKEFLEQGKDVAQFKNYQEAEEPASEEQDQPNESN